MATIPYAGILQQDNEDNPEVIRGMVANADFFRIPEFKSDFFRALKDAAEETKKHLVIYYFSNDIPLEFTDNPYFTVIWLGLRSYSSYRNLIKILGPEFAFIPLRDEEFSNYKSVLKCAEFGFSNIIGIYSNVDLYNEFVEDGKDGFLCDNTYTGWNSVTKKILTLSEEQKNEIKKAASYKVSSLFNFREINKNFRELISKHLKTSQNTHSAINSGYIIPDVSRFKHIESYEVFYIYEYLKVKRELEKITNQPILKTIKNKITLEINSLLKKIFPKPPPFFF